MARRNETLQWRFWNQTLKSFGHIKCKHPFNYDTSKMPQRRTGSINDVNSKRPQAIIIYSREKHYYNGRSIIIKMEST